MNELVTITILFTYFRGNSGCSQIDVRNFSVNFHQFLYAATASLKRNVLYSFKIECKILSYDDVILYKLVFLKAFITLI